MNRWRKSEPRVACCLLSAAWVPMQVLGAEVDVSKLPPPEKRAVTFEHDVRPIFEQSCFRCHTGTRPKSRFSLDNREAALKGGDNGIDIIPGDSAKSPLIHYVAGIAPDIEMPPSGKGQPLTPEQIAILRRWIDDGASWGATNVSPALTFSITPELRWISVQGDNHKFREVEGVREGSGGGISDFNAQQQLGSDAQVKLSGRFLAPDNDFALRLELSKRDLGFIRTGFEEWRRYYDDTGGYYRLFAEPSFNLGRDLHLDLGRAWFDAGLTLPNWPVIVVGYEYQFKDGAKSTLEWGNVAGKRIYPASEEIHEHVHIAKLDVTYEFNEWLLQENARVEWYDLRTTRDDAGTFSIGPVPDSVIYTKDHETHVQGMNTLHLERQVRDWWLLSGGYYYSRLEGDSSLDQVTLNPIGIPAAGSFWSANGILLKRESHIGSLGSLFLPVTWLTFSTGVQAEWTRQSGFGNVQLDSGDPNTPDKFLIYPATVQSDLDKQKFSENGTLRFTAIPWTVLFVEGRFDQERIGQFEQDAPAVGTSPDPAITFLRNTDYSNDQKEWRAGFNTSPWRWLAVSGHYKERSSDNDYDNSKIALDTAGYSAFIRARSISTSECEGKLTLKPLPWLKTSFTFQDISTDYSTTTDPFPSGPFAEGLQAGKYRARTYGAQATVTPFQRLYLSGSFTYGTTRLVTANNGDPSIVPYDGNTYALAANATYALNLSTDLSANYSFSRADYGQANVFAGLPLGLTYTRHALMAGIVKRWSKSVSTNLKYGFYDYSEPSTGGVNNYTAHGVFASITVKWP